MSADMLWSLEVRHDRMGTSALGKWAIWQIRITRHIVYVIVVFSYHLQVEFFATGDRVELSSSGLICLAS
jgi:hypothetical protein